MHYKEHFYRGKLYAIDVLNSATSREDIGQLLVAISYHERDLDFAMKIIENYCYDSDSELQGLALLCLSHLAKFNDNIPVAKIVKIFNDIIESDKCHEEVIKDRIYAALNDFYSYCPAVFNGIYEKHPLYLQQLDLGVDL